MFAFVTCDVEGVVAAAAGRPREAQGGKRPSAASDSMTSRDLVDFFAAMH